MGYTRDFLGCFKCTPILTPAQRDYLTAFSEKRRVQRRTRNGEKTKWVHWHKLSVNEPLRAQDMPDPLRIAVGLPIGPQGAYFTGGLGFCGQDDDASFIDNNQQPKGQPGLWCNWRPDETGQYIGWDGGEKFSSFKEWMEYIIVNFLAKWGVTLDGVVRYQGERKADFGSMVVANNVVTLQPSVKLRPTHPKAMTRHSTLIFGENLLDSVAAIERSRKRHG